MSSLSPIPIIEMGLRRAKGLDTANISSLYSYINGFKSTSHV